MESQSVTVVIVNWNSGSLLAQCLEHLAAQTRAPEKVLVMDNGSSDDSLACAQRFAHVTVYRLGANLGFAAANNRAIALADTQFVALLNPDANVEPDWLERLLFAARANPGVAGFGSRQMAGGASDTVDGLGDVYHFSGLAWRRGFGRRLRPADLVATEIFAACGAAALFRRDALRRAGGFDEDYFCYGEDVDLGFRLRLAGERCLYVPEAVVRHRGSATSGGYRSDFSTYHGHRNLVWTFIKDMPGALFWILLPFHVLQNMAIIGYYTLQGRGRVILRAKWDALMGVPDAWRKRTRIQAQRVASLPQIGCALSWRMLPRKRARVGGAGTSSSRKGLER